MKLFAAVLVALPLLAACSPVENLNRERQAGLPRSESEGPAHLTRSENEGPAPADGGHSVGGDYDGESDYADVNEETQPEETNSPPSPDALRKADDEASKERRRLANLRRRFSSPLYKKHNNETSDALAESLKETEDKDKSVNSKDDVAEIAEEPEEEGSDDERPTPSRPRRRFGGRHQADQSESVVVSEEGGEPQDPKKSDPPFRPRGIGRFSGRHQADETDSKSAPNEENREIQDSEASDSPSRQRGIGRFGGRHHAYESESDPSEENSEIQDPKANDEPYRRKGIGHFGGRQQEEESESDSKIDSEDTEGDDDAAPQTDEGRHQAGRLGRFGRRRQEDESEPEAIRDNGNEVPNETDQLARSSTSAPIRGLARLLNARLRSSRLQNDQAEDLGEQESTGGASSDIQETNVAYTDDQETQGEFSSNDPQPGRLRSKYQ